MEQASATMVQRRKCCWAVLCTCCRGRGTSHVVGPRPSSGSGAPSPQGSQGAGSSLSDRHKREDAEISAEQALCKHVDMCLSGVFWGSGHVAGQVLLGRLESR